MGWAWKGRVQRNVRLAKQIFVGVHRFPSLLPLYDLQASLIEHKFPTSGITEYVLSAAGDIFREMTKESPDLGYIGEKWRTLTQYCFTRHGFRSGDMDELKEMVESSDFASGYKEFMANLQILRNATYSTSMYERRKQIMLASLDMVKALAEWFSNPNVEVPVQVSTAYLNLGQALEEYWPARFKW